MNDNEFKIVQECLASNDDIDQVENLRNWMYDVDVETVDAVLEFLHDQEMLNESGEQLAKDFWERYIKISGKDI